MEIIRRSVIMLSPGQPAFAREDAIRILSALKAALEELERRARDV